MVANVEAVPVPAAPAGPARSGTRRDTLRGLFGAAAGLVLIPVVAASWPLDHSHDGHDGHDGQGGPGGGGFDEMYRGRHIQGVPAPGGRTAADGGAQWQVTVDGRRLHLMRRADGTWLSMIDHYRSYDTPLEAARAAVDELGPGEQLRETGHTHMEGGYGPYA